MAPKRIEMKNRMTGKCDVIIQHEIEKVDWGFHFFVDSELDAYKAAYVYKGHPAVKVEFARGVQRWMVTVFNQFAVDAGLADGCRCGPEPKKKQN